MPTHSNKWFSHKYGNNLQYNWRALRDGYASGFYFSHMACPFRKSSMEDVWHVFGTELNETCLHRFRTPQDIMHQVFSVWEMVNGNFSPQAEKELGLVVPDIEGQLPEIKELFLSQTLACICLNDSRNVKKFDETRKKLQETLGYIFCEKSIFEI